MKSKLKFIFSVTLIASGIYLVARECLTSYLSGSLELGFYLFGLLGAAAIVFGVGLLMKIDLICFRRSFLRLLPRFFVLQIVLSLLYLLVTWNSTLQSRFYTSVRYGFGFPFPFLFKPTEFYFWGSLSRNNDLNRIYFEKFALLFDVLVLGISTAIAAFVLCRKNRGAGQSDGKPGPTAGSLARKDQLG